MHEATITAYDVLTGEEQGSLVLRVNDHIRNGWQPVGSLRFYFDPHHVQIFYQTIVKYDTQPQPKRL